MTRLMMAGVVIFASVASGVQTVWTGTEQAAFVREVRQRIEAFEHRIAEHPNDPQLLTSLSKHYLDLGGAVEGSEEERIGYHEAGARLAERALARDPHSADAHFYYAANLGSAVQLRGAMASALVVQELKSHTSRALDLNPHHSPALHMMGRMLDALPWFLGGDEQEAEDYLQRAVVADASNVRAGVDLAQFYLAREKTAEARDVLEQVRLQLRDITTWEDGLRYLPELTRITQRLGASQGDGHVSGTPERASETAEP